MRSSDLHTSMAHIRDAYEELQNAWQEAVPAWNDSVSRGFCDNHLEPMGPVVKQSLDAMTRMAHLVSQMHQQCES